MLCHRLAGVLKDILLVRPQHYCQLASAAANHSMLSQVAGSVFLMGSTVTFTQMFGYSIALLGLLGECCLLSLVSRASELTSILPPSVFKTKAEVVDQYVIRVKSMLR